MEKAIEKVRVGLKLVIEGLLEDTLDLEETNTPLDRKKDVDRIILELIKYRYGQRERSGDLKKESIGDVYSYEKFSLADLKNGLPPDLVEELNLFKKWII